MTKAQLWLVIAVALLAGLAGGTVAGGLAVAQGKNPHVISANQFRLLGPDGDTRATLEVTPQGGVALVMNWINGRPGVLISANHLGESRVFLADERGAPRTGLAVTSKRLAGLVVNDSRGKLRAAVMEQNGTAQVSITRPGQPRRFALDLMVSRRGFPSLAFKDPLGHNRLLLAMGQENKPLMWLFDDAGRRLWAVPGEDR
ncbi:MAG: hypothetical protein K9K66_19155 [Desulfarculaceae bacterium]|nr:hypothetical protein [Desulfarculaceae bacterium]MCF8074098.1 hypothetical protein [Desulfarculaceae bacterium]MCF8103779.1 hypothetical protein [Desulfarculaceae bacterium]MCF8116832.1 hypothetical protein [Desulfarculaceae bacterium]